MLLATIVPNWAMFLLAVVVMGIALLALTSGSVRYNGVAWGFSGLVIGASLFCLASFYIGRDNAEHQLDGQLEEAYCRTLIEIAPVGEWPKSLLPLRDSLDFDNCSVQQ